MKIAILVCMGALVLAACATKGEDPAVIAAQGEQAIGRSWQGVPPGWQPRLVQDETQKLCSSAHDKPAPALAQKIEAANRAQGVVYPASGKLVGDFKRGEAIAQSGFGLRVGDTTDRPTGGNCYACHQLSKEELSFGTLGPSLYQYGKLRGNSEAIVKYTYDKIWNAQAFRACTNMPRFGSNKLLTPEQVADVVALLLDPQSPINR